MGGGNEDARSTVSMSTVSSLAMEPPLTIDEAGFPSFLEKVKHELNKDFGEQTTLEHDRVTDDRIWRVIVNHQSLVTRPLDDTCGALLGLQCLKGQRSLGSLFECQVIKSSVTD